MEKVIKIKNISILQTILLILRIAIGWHFLYEGLAKLFAGSWSSYNFLNLSQWVFSGFFHWIVNSPGVLKFVDFFNIWGLIFIGLGLFFGIFTRVAAASGVLLLSFYYVANPPLIGLDFGVPAEGHYLVVNKNLIEMFVLIVFIVIPKNFVPGIDSLWSLIRDKFKKEKKDPNPYDKIPGDGIGRRELIKNLIPLPIFGGFVLAAMKKKGWLSYEEKFLEETDGITTATIKSFDFSSIKKLKEKIPSSRVIGDMEISRVILGGNLIGGWAHARDLIYVSKLIKSYHTDEKVYNTFRLAEESGINTFLTSPVLSRVINGYWRRGLGNIKFISDCGGVNLIEGVKTSIDNGASACYIHGGFADSYVRAGRIDKIQEALEFIKQNGLPAGIGAHELNTVKGCVDYGLKPDFWMKTLHLRSYLNVPHELNKNKITTNEEVMYQNVFCNGPDETIAYMETLKQPWIAFKILAAGAIEPEVGFRYAFESGADFICVGMYDFQVVDNANIAMDVLNSNFKSKRPRPWLV
ncbi:MAG: DoxX family protein [Bacteroidales bacterium]|nr:DoxX family protein [Bacteroidales bacterium]